MKKILMISLLFVMCGFATTPSYAESLETVSGIVNRNEKGTISIKINNRQYNAYSNKLSVVQEMQELNNGDLITASGILRDQKQEAFIQIESIYFVGLKKLLGAWRSSDQNVFTFQDFDSVWLKFAVSESTLWQALNVGGNSTLLAHAYNYTITPESSGRWTLYIYQNNHLAIGILSFSEKGQPTIEFLDPKTGEVFHNVTLKRTSPHQIRM